MTANISFNFGDPFAAVGRIVEKGMDIIHQQHVSHVQNIEDQFDKNLNDLNGLVQSCIIFNRLKVPYPAKLYCYMNIFTKTKVFTLDAISNNSCLQLEPTVWEEEIVEFTSQKIREMLIMLQNPNNRLHVRERIESFRYELQRFSDHIWKRIKPNPTGTKIQDKARVNELAVAYPLPYSLLTVKTRQNNNEQSWIFTNGQVYYGAGSNLVLDIYSPNDSMWPDELKGNEFLCLTKIREGGSTRLQYVDNSFQDAKSSKNINFKLKVIGPWCCIQKKQQVIGHTKLFVP